MYISAGDNYFAAAYGDVLTIYDALNTSNHRVREFNSSISSLYATKTFVLIGLFSGKIIAVDKNLGWEYEIANIRHRVRCIFCCGDTFYFGSDDAKVFIYMIRTEDEIYYEDSDLSLNSVFTKSQHGFEFRVINEITHNAPVISVAVDGDTTYILDMKGKIMVYPDRFAYDIYASCMSVKNYLFAAEKNFLYCKTQEAFSCILTMRDEIVEFKFSNKGSILFVKTQNNLYVYNKNFKEIKKIGIEKCAFVFDELSNRLVFYDGKHLTFINNIVESINYLCEEMDNIKFEKTRIHERIVKNEFEEESVPFGDNGNFIKTYATKKNKANAETNYFNKNFERLDESTDDEAIHYNNNLNLFEEENDDNYEKNKVEMQKEINIKSFMSGSFLSSDGQEVMCYNKVGFMIKRKDEIEVIFHDTSIPRKKYSEDYVLGSLSEKGVLFSNESDFLFYDGTSKWEKDLSEIKLISITDKLIVCVLSNEMHVYKFSGIKIFSCLISNPITLSVENENILLFCRNKVIFFDKDFNITQYDFDYKLSFCVLEQSIFYFYHENYLFMLRSGVAIKLMKVNGFPLCINNSYLITCNGKITEAPIIEFYRVKADDLFIDPSANKNEKEKFLVDKIEEAQKKKDYVLVEDLIDLLRDEVNIKRFKIFNSTVHEFKDFNDEMENAVENQPIKNEIVTEIYSSSVIKTPLKTKRYNAFAKK